jgi:hypothetical protein
MAKKNTPNTVDPYIHTNVPMFYADQPAALMLGPLVSRLTFGVEETDDGDYPRPVVTIALPTRALMQLVNDLNTEFESSSFRKHSAASLMKFAQQVAVGGKANSTNALIKIPRSKPAPKIISK